MVMQSRIMFRFGAIDFIQWAHDKDIPMVVMSAGISEVIHASFNLLGSVEHAKVISNRFTYKDGKTDGYHPLIHPFNKQSTLYSQMGDLRKNIILMGDILEDHHMVDTSKHETVLRIGFLNKSPNDQDEYNFEMKRYKEKFDIVISDDGSICPILHTLSILGDHKLTERGANLTILDGFQELNEIIKLIN